ncbi:DUF1190 domain-containing protein [Marinomonas agarivorans]|nr:DUF1190 domain-containing protein [Marinomonas agarivorans]
MKRSRVINLDRMRKNPLEKPLLRPLTLAIASITLAACSQPEQDVQIVNSVEDCVDNTTLTADQCQAAYEKALTEAHRTAPRYQSQSHCESEFGYNQCYQTGNNFFVPFMAGWMVSSLLNNASNTYNPVYHYRNSSSSYRDRLMTADGSVIGRAGQKSYKVPSTNLKPKPTVTRTVSRGGFGAVASAKSNWGGGKKSSWGG